MSSRPKQSDLKTFKRLIGYISRYWELKAILGLILFTTASTAISPAIVGNIIDIIRAVAEGNPIKPGVGVGRLAYQLLSPFATTLSSIRGMDPGRATLFVFSLTLVVLALLEGEGHAVGFEDSRGVEVDDRNPYVPHEQKNGDNRLRQEDPQRGFHDGLNAGSEHHDAQNHQTDIEYRGLY